MPKTVMWVLIAIVFCVVASEIVSSHRKIAMARAGLQECQTSWFPSTVVWQKECPK